MDSAKRQHGKDVISDLDVKKARGDTDSGRLEAFMTWCKEEKLTLCPKVRVGRDGSCAQYGMIATEDIDAGECLFEIPRRLLLTPENSAIASLMKKESDALQSKSGWVPLIVALMHEYTCPTSRWQPYVALVPDFDQLDLPMFWPRLDLEANLKGTGVPEAVARDLTNITQEFNEVRPFIEKHPDLFSEQCLQLDFYKKMVAFVMAYSFTEPAPVTDDDDDSDGDDADGCNVNIPPMMVPMADILNHVAKNNAHLDFGKESLKMVAVKPILKGEEVYNTYGHLSNCQLLHMYGFAEPYPDNHNDTVDIPMKLSREVSGEDNDLLKDKWTFLTTTGVVSEDGVFVLGEDGILTEEEMHETLKVLCMEKEEFNEHKEQEGWNDADNDDSMSNADIRQLPQKWKDLLIRISEHCLASYNSSIESDSKQLQPDEWKTLDRRQHFSILVRHGQMKLLENLVKVCKTSGDG